MSKPRPTPFILALSDLAALFVACALAYFLRSLFPHQMVLGDYVRLAPLLLFFIPLYAASSLYPGITLPMPDRLKGIAVATCLGFLFLGAVLLVSQRGNVYSRVVLVGAWFIALFSVPLLRYWARRMFARFSWWGYPTVIFGHPDLAGAYYEHLLRNKGTGFNPVAVCVLEDIQSTANINYVTLHNTAKEIKKQLQTLKNQRSDVIAALVMDKMSTAQQNKLLAIANSNFTNILLLPESTFNIRLSVRVATFCGQLALGLRQNLLDYRRLQMKRSLDLVLTLLMLPFLLPIIAFIYVLIRLDSPGPGFYRHIRLGYGGREIRVWKFRTMHKNSGEMLTEILEKKPELLQEWEENQKIKNDPRITRVGHFLRRYSLDELPQIFNVFVGSMSLVGPRPIITQEIPRYGAAYSTYTQVKPGITGIWQVSGRNNVSYAARVAMDEYYIANWSVWLDIYILIRTPMAALSSNGAY